MVEFKINECTTCKNHEGNGGYCYIKHIERHMCDPLKNYIPVDWYKEILVLRAKIADLDGRNVKLTKENGTIQEQLDEMGHRWESTEADVANLTDAIGRVVGFLKIYPIGTSRRPGDNLDLCLDILQSELAKINSTDVKPKK